MKIFSGNRHRTLLSKKYYSMLLGGSLTMMLVSVLLMADTVVAGTFVGADAVAGITLVTPLYSVAAFFGSVFSLGVPIVYSTEMGKFNKEGADKAFGLGLLMCVSTGLILFLGATFCGDVYLRSCTPLEPVLSAARDYLYWLRFSMLLLPVGMLLVEMVYSDGDETLSTASNMIQGGGNLIASIFLSRIMGVRGIGLASFLFNLVSVLILLVHFLKKSNTLRPNLFFSPKMLLQVARYSMVDACSYLFLAVLTIVLNTFVSSRFGAEYLIIVSVIALVRELQIVFDGIGESITPLISVYIGEECYSGVQAVYYMAEKTAIVEGLLVTALMSIFAPFIPAILDVSDPGMVAVASTGIRIMVLGSTFTSLLYLLTSYYLLIDKIPLGLLISALRDVMVSAPLTVLLGSIFGLNGIFAGMAAAPLLAYLFNLIYTAKRYGKDNSPSLLKLIAGGTSSALFELVAEPEQIMEVQGRVSDLLKENGMDKKTVHKAELIIEEIFMLIREKNNGKKVLGECAVLLRPEGVQLIIRDDGEHFDISDENAAVTSLGAFVVACYMEKLAEEKHHLKTLSFNRTSFMLKTNNGRDMI